MDFRGIETCTRQLQDAPVPAGLVESRLPSFGRPIVGPAMDQQRQRAFIHWNGPNLVSGDHSGLTLPRKILHAYCRLRAYSFVFQYNRGPITCSMPSFAIMTRTSSVPGARNRTPPS